MGIKFTPIILLLLSTCIQAQQIVVSHKPESPLKEIIGNDTFVNADFIIENKGADTLALTKIVVRMFDDNDRLIKEKFLDNNGTAPSIDMISKREILSGQTLNVFNPFAQIPTDIVVKLEFTFTFNDNITVSHILFPQVYKQPLQFALPVKTQTMVYDGHDLNAHHRRFDYEFAPIKELGFTSNFMRYAYDFVTVDENGKMYKTDGVADSDWYSMGSAVAAVADGTVVAVIASKPDDKKFDIGALKTNQMELFGNYVMIQHGSKLFSIYGHLQQNTCALKVGYKIKQGQIIGKMGTSGSAMIPHLHFEIRNGSGPNSEGLPSYFSNYAMVLGNKKQQINYGTVNTGDIFVPNK